MEIVSPFPAVVALVVAVVTVGIIDRLGKTRPASPGRYATIDGLRGYLALFVFLHHSVVWYFYVRSGHWSPPPSKLYNQFGETSVALFFMVSGFLFYSKLINDRRRGVNWQRLYASRVLRICPLYFVVFGLVLAVVSFLSGFTVRESAVSLANEIAHWCTFTGLQNINGVKETWAIIAGVPWTLRYEWVFYYSLPLLALTVGAAVPLPLLLLSSAAVAVAALFMKLSLIYIAPFGGGIAAAFLVRHSSMGRIAASSGATVAIPVCLALAVAASDYYLLKLMLLTVAFCLIACGNGLCGILTNRVSILMGEWTYSIYLLHGMMLFVLFRFILGTRLATTFSPLQHWCVIMCCVPVLLVGSSLTFKFIEVPSMAFLPRLVSWLESRSLWSPRRITTALPEE